MTIWPRKHKSKKAYYVFLFVINPFTRLKSIYRIGRILKICETVHSIFRHANKLCSLTTLPQLISKSLSWQTVIWYETIRLQVWEVSAITTVVLVWGDSCLYCLLCKAITFVCSNTDHFLCIWYKWDPFMILSFKMMGQTDYTHKDVVIFSNKNTDNLQSLVNLRTKSK